MLFILSVCIGGLETPQRGRKLSAQGDALADYSLAFQAVFSGHQ